MNASDAAVRRTFPPHPASVGEARALTRAALGAPTHEMLLDDAQLLVSEVVTNALVHAGTTIDVAVTVLGESVRVEVSDGAAHLPVRRDYAALAGTGRGLRLVEELADEWGVDVAGDGKTVWFELGPDGADPREPGLRAQSAQLPRVDQSEDAVVVTLRNVPLLLHAAWHQHAESLLREYLLFGLDDLEAGDEIEVHAAAHEAMALLVEGIPAPELGEDPEELLAAATEPLVSSDRVRLVVPRTAVTHFAVLDEALESAYALAQEGRFLTPPTQPEMRAMRRWLCREVARQSEGEAPTAWSDTAQTSPLQAPLVNRDTEQVAASEWAVLAADDRSRIVAVSPSALELLGYTRAEELVGRRILAIVPARYHQAHLAGFTLHLHVGRSPLLGRTVTVPAVRCDGSEVLVELTVTARQSAQGERLFVAELRESVKG